MTFSPDSMLVKNAILCLTAGIYKSVEELPDIGNFRDAVREALER